MEKLTEKQINQFINEGFLRVDNAFPTVVADECRELLWKAMGLDPDDRSTWTKPVIRIGDMSAEPFKQSVNTPILLNAYDQLAGPDNWLPRYTMGSFPIRFPVQQPASDTGWHVDASFPGEDSNDYMQWRINVYSSGRALLMLFLFSDVSEKDAPTRIRIGSHFDVARILLPEGERGLSFMELAGQLDITKGRVETLATGKAGTVYLCHPFIAHAAREHRGSLPKFMAQPPLIARRDFQLNRAASNYCPVELAILSGIGKFAST